jgi:hypothetical protein
MLDGEMPFLDDINDLVLEASDLLDQFRDRGMHDTIQRRVQVVDKTDDAHNLEKLKDLVAKFKAAIHSHDAKVAAAQAALDAREFMDGIHPIDESFALQSANEASCSTKMTSSCATEGNTEGSCTITISHTQRTIPKRLSELLFVFYSFIFLMVAQLLMVAELQENKSSTAPDAARLTAARAVNARTGPTTGRPPSKTVRCMMTEFRLFTFETGRQYLAAGTLDHIKWVAMKIHRMCDQAFRKDKIFPKKDVA